MSNIITDVFSRGRQFAVIMAFTYLTVSNIVLLAKSNALPAKVKFNGGKAWNSACEPATIASLVTTGNANYIALLHNSKLFLNHDEWF